ncbi:hypothetical protein ACFVS9_06760 [Streptomyces sp. NPDC058008]|uniref:hypothetical protein n=1 Tax=Streptomyces sp. NPDC058008 TaxID=3346303 RepID=UPI0036EAC790
MEEDETREKSHAVNHTSDGEIVAENKDAQREDVQVDTSGWFNSLPAGKDWWRRIFALVIILGFFAVLVLMKPGAASISAAGISASIIIAAWFKVDRR